MTAEKCEAAQVRARILALRRAMDVTQVARLSEQVVQGFQRDSGLAPSDWKGLCVGIYRAMPGELDLRGLEMQLVQRGARVCFPRVERSKEPDGHLEFLEFPESTESQNGRQWSTGSFGIEEPHASGNAVKSSQIDVFFVPGVAFGLRGERIGMGKGYYDRYLPQAPQALKIALAFDFQLLSKLKQEPWDQPMDWIWTEKRQIRLRAWTPIRKQEA